MQRLAEEVLRLLPPFEQAAGAEAAAPPAPEPPPLGIDWLGAEPRKPL
jgi:hypothetical protein